jgi:hypothetical protein
VWAARYDTTLGSLKPGRYIGNGRSAEARRKRSANPWSDDYEGSEEARVAKKKFFIAKGSRVAAEMAAAVGKTVLS